MYVVLSNHLSLFFNEKDYSLFSYINRKDSLEGMALKASWDELKIYQVGSDIHIQIH